MLRKILLTFCILASFATLALSLASARYDFAWRSRPSPNSCISLTLRDQIFWFFHEQSINPRVLDHFYGTLEGLDLQPNTQRSIPWIERDTTSRFEFNSFSTVMTSRADSKIDTTSIRFPLWIAAAFWLIYPVALVWRWRRPRPTNRDNPKGAKPQTIPDADDTPNVDLAAN
jgi:hypothetical protein